MTGIECAMTGTLTKDADARTGRSGKPFALLNLIVGDGDTRQFVSAIVFGDAAGNVATLEKGRRVYLEGKIEISEWTDRDGNKKHGLKVASFNAVEVSKIGRRRERKANERPARTNAAAKAPAADDDLNDTIPF
jgi:single-stranded DNA-binding protein